MSLIICPECNSRISDRATTCPNCGFTTGNKRAISKIKKEPAFKYELLDFDVNDRFYEIITYDDNKNLNRALGKIENIEKYAPEIADVIKKEVKSAKGKKEKEYVAIINKSIQKMIDDGTYHFSIDKEGNLLPTIRDSKTIRKQVRLAIKDIPIDLVPTISNVALQATLNQIIEEIKELRKAIEGLYGEFQKNRIAKADSAIDKFNQANKMKDLKLQQIAILNAISTATDAKRELMIDFSAKLNDIIEASNKNNIKIGIEQIKGGKDAKRDENTKMAFSELVMIINMMQIEYQGYAIIGELNAMKEVVRGFQIFISKNKLNNRDTLLKMNSFVKNNDAKKANSKIVDEMCVITKKIENFKVCQKLEEKNETK